MKVAAVGCVNGFFRDRGGGWENAGSPGNDALTRIATGFGLRGDQRAQVGELEPGVERVAGLEDVGEELTLRLLQLEHLLLDGAGGDEFVAGHHAGLTDAVRAIRGLRLGGGILLRVEVHDGVGVGEIEVGAVGL